MSDSHFTARFTRDEDGYWLGEILEEPGCHSFGKSLQEAQRRTREALAGWLEVPDPATLHLVNEVVVDTGEEVLDLGALVRQRRDLERLQGEVARNTIHAARTLLHQGFTVRDVASALSISPARVQQIAQKSPPRSKRRSDR